MAETLSEHPEKALKRRGAVRQSTALRLEATFGLTLVSPWRGGFSRVPRVKKSAGFTGEFGGVGVFLIFDRQSHIPMVESSY